MVIQFLPKTLENSRGLFELWSNIIHLQIETKSNNINIYKLTPATITAVILITLNDIVRERGKF